MSDFFHRQLAKAAGLQGVEPGREIRLRFDLALAHDGTGPEILRLLKSDGRSIAGASRVLLTLDHCFPAPTVEDREFQLEISAYAKQHRLHLYNKGQGVLHQVVAEEESLWPGMIIIGADGHVATAGAFGAIAFPTPPAAFVEAVSEGGYAVTVPEQVVIALEGPLEPAVMTRDVAMHIMARHGSRIRNRAVLLTGTTTDLLNISEKMALCNFLPEAGVATALVLPQGEREPVDIRIDATAVKPLVGAPGPPSEFVRPGTLADERISMAVVGGCSSGRLDDMRAVARVLSKSEVHPDVTFIVTPGSKNIMESMDKLHISTVLRNAGVVITPPGCGPCPGRHFGVLGTGDTAVTATVRNTPGRMGAAGARIYLASPLTVAVSAVRGKITEPWSYDAAPMEA